MFRRLKFLQMPQYTFEQPKEIFYRGRAFQAAGPLFDPVGCDAGDVQVRSPANRRMQEKIEGLSAGSTQSFYFAK